MHDGWEFSERIPMPLPEKISHNNPTILCQQKEESVILIKKLHAEPQKLYPYSKAKNASIPEST